MTWALTFFLIVILAALLGFGATAVTIAAVARLSFYAAVVLFLVTLINRFMRRV